jgi:ABC-type uncharacterized transport system substrate-binding protein
MIGRLSFASAMALLATVPQAGAHPHVFIEMTSDVVFNDAGLINAINVEWVFDPDYSAMATEDLDVNKGRHADHRRARAAGQGKHR